MWFCSGHSLTSSIGTFSTWIMMMMTNVIELMFVSCIVGNAFFVDGHRERNDAVNWGLKPCVRISLRFHFSFGPQCIVNDANSFYVVHSLYLCEFFFGLFCSCFVFGYVRAYVVRVCREGQRQIRNIFHLFHLIDLFIERWCYVNEVERKRSVCCNRCFVLKNFFIICLAIIESSEVYVVPFLRIVWKLKCVFINKTVCGLAT